MRPPAVVGTENFKKIENQVKWSKHVEIGPIEHKMGMLPLAMESGTKNCKTTENQVDREIYKIWSMEYGIRLRPLIVEFGTKNFKVIENLVVLKSAH